MNSGGPPRPLPVQRVRPEAYGGSASGFGCGSVAGQNPGFNNAIAAGGESSWSPNDGC
jgi:hypothetical protein